MSRHPSFLLMMALLGLLVASPMVSGSRTASLYRRGLILARKDGNSNGGGAWTLPKGKQAHQKQQQHPQSQRQALAQPLPDNPRVPPKRTPDHQINSDTSLGARHWYTLDGITIHFAVGHNPFINDNARLVGQGVKKTMLVVFLVTFGTVVVAFVGYRLARMVKFRGSRKGGKDKSGVFDDGQNLHDIMIMFDNDEIPMLPMRNHASHLSPMRPSASLI